MGDIKLHGRQNAYAAGKRYIIENQPSHMCDLKMHKWNLSDTWEGGDIGDAPRWALRVFFYFRIVCRSVLEHHVHIIKSPFYNSAIAGWCSLRTPSKKYMGLGVRREFLAFAFRILFGKIPRNLLDAYSNSSLLQPRCGGVANHCRGFRRGCCGAMLRRGTPRKRRGEAMVVIV